MPHTELPKLIQLTLNENQFELIMLGLGAVDAIYHSNMSGQLVVLLATSDTWEALTPDEHAEFYTRLKLLSQAFK